METTNFDEMIVRSQGLKGLKNQAITGMLLYGARKVKTHFGVDMSFRDPGQVRAAIKWIENNDNNFKSHIANPYLLGSKISSQDPIIDRSFILKVDKRTYAFVSGKLDRNYSRDGGEARNTISMYVFGKKAFKVFRDITQFIESSNTSSQMMYSITASGDNDRNYWTCTGSTLTPRPMDTLFFDPGIKERIISHLNNWLQNEDVYRSRGLKYKTGILLYGTQGTGKSSMASAIANYLHCGLITIDCTTFQNLNTAEVAESINADDDRYVVLLDEIDSIFGKRDDAETDDIKNKRISKLLTFLDSPQSPNNVIFVATTNFYDRLDKAVLRKGRFDIAEEMRDIHKEAALEMCKSFNLSDSDINKIMSNTTFPINPSTLQDIILNTFKKEAVL